MSPDSLTLCHLQMRLLKYSVIHGLSLLCLVTTLTKCHTNPAVYSNKSSLYLHIAQYGKTRSISFVADGKPKLLSYYGSSPT